MYTNNELRTLLLNHFNSIGVLENSALSWLEAKYNYNDYLNDEPPWLSDTMYWVNKALHPESNPFAMFKETPKKERARRVINAN